MGKIEKSESNGITFQAIFVKATTTIDGGWRVTFDVAFDEAARVIELAEYRDQTLQVAVLPNIWNQS